MRKFLMKVICNENASTTVDELCKSSNSDVTVIECTEITDVHINVAKEIWDIANKSSEHGNALIDLLGEDVYNKICRVCK